MVRGAPQAAGRRRRPSGFGQGGRTRVQTKRCNPSESWWDGLSLDELRREVGRRVEAAGLTEEDVQREVDAVRHGDAQADPWWACLSLDELWAEIGRRARAAGITEEDVEQEIEAYRAGR